MTPVDLVDLSRWAFIQFATPETQAAALQRYRTYLERRTAAELAPLSLDPPVL